MQRSLSVVINEEYKVEMDLPMEGLAVMLSNLGFDGEPHNDAYLIEVATRKIKTLYEMILATKFSPEMLRAIMKE